MKKKRSIIFTAVLFLLLASLAACRGGQGQVDSKKFEENGLSYAVISEEQKTCAVLGFSGDATQTVEIPSAAGDYRVIYVAPRAFFEQKEIETVRFGSELLKSGNNAFCNCSALRELDLPEGLKTVGWNAFSGCETLERVSFPASLSAVERNAFYDCRNLARVEISDVGAWCRIAFEFYHDRFYSNPMWYAKELILNGEPVTDLTLPDDLTSIGNGAFLNCKTLKTVVFPDGLTTIGKYAFANCEGLTGIALPDSVTGIGERAFFSCKAMTSATLGNGLRMLSSYAFAECESLRGIAVPESVQQLNEFTFASCFALETVKLPAGLQKIEMGVFRCCGNLSGINFAGTIEQWKAIDKEVFDADSIYADLDWNYGCNFNANSASVICTDGVTD